MSQQHTTIPAPPSLFPRLNGVVRRILCPCSMESTLNRQLSGYPRNHDYFLHNGSLLPGRRLQSRWQRIAELYPNPLASLLDVGSCKGYFVLEAARRPTCRAAVGIDVCQPFVNLSRAVARQINQPNTRFHLASLDRFAADPELNNAAPFQTILLLNVYHYLFAGSQLSPLAYRDHRPILQLLHSLCSDRVIFSSPIDLPDTPEQVQQHCRDLNISHLYTRDHFLTAADEFFRVDDQGLWGRRPLLILHRRPNP